MFRIVFNKRGKLGKYVNVAKLSVAVSMKRAMSDNLHQKVASSSLAGRTTISYSNNKL